jgi:hypothetical protein
MGEGGTFLRVEIDMRENMKMIKRMGRVLIIGKMEGRRLGYGKTIRVTEKQSLLM